jgi:hypothetical protein
MHKPTIKFSKMTNEQETEMERFKIELEAKTGDRDGLYGHKD